MKTICIDSRYIGSRPSGISEVVNGLIGHVPPLMSEVRFVLLRSPARSEPLSNADNVEELTVDAAANGPSTMWMLPETVDLAKVDLFHSTFNILPARLKMKTLTTVHDIMWLTNPRWCNPSPWGLIERRFYAHGIRRALELSDRIATVSEATRQEILRLYPDLTAKINVTFSGVSQEFRPVQVEAESLKLLGLPPNRPIVLSVGQNAPYKNHEAVLCSFASAFSGKEGPMLVFVQRQSRQGSRLRTLATRLGIADRVHFLGAVGFDDLLQLYSAATVMLHPSLCEGFGNPVAEAMACGCPVITSNISAMPEVAGGAARLVDPRDEAMIANALQEIVGTPKLRENMRTAGLQRASELNWRSFAEANAAIYRELLDGA